MASRRTPRLDQPRERGLALRPTYDPDRFREARVQGSYSVESIVEQAGKLEIAFDCKPQF